MEVRKITEAERRTLLGLYRYAFGGWLDEVPEDSGGWTPPDDTFGLFDESKLVSALTVVRFQQSIRSVLKGMGGIAGELSAILDAVVAPGALPLNHVPGLPLHLHLKVPHLPRHLAHLTVRQQLNVRVMTHQAHLRRQNTTRTVERGKRFVEFGHFAADAGGFFDEVDFVAGISDI